MKKFKNDKKLSLFIRFIYEKDYYISGYNHQSIFLKNIKKVKGRTDCHSFVFHVFKKNEIGIPVGSIYIKTDMKKEINYLCNHGIILDCKNKNIFHDILEEVEFLDNIQYWG